MSNIVIIGAGLFGSMAAQLAEAAGHTVQIVDSNEPWAASKASGCVIAPSWLASLDSDELKTAMQLLDEHYGLIEVEFATNVLKKFRAHRIDTAKVLRAPTHRARVTTVTPNGKVTLSTGEVLNGKVLVAAGIACGELLGGMPLIKPMWGAALHVKGQLAEPRLHVYAPYRQAVAFNRDRGSVWVGDGTALVEKTWTKESGERISNTRLRAAKLFGLTDTPKTVVLAGARPYAPMHKTGYFARVYPRVWVSTGGAKNGTALAILQAQRFVREAK
jgi:glycine/D-amino acid oxidase-like deaminating enzyme